MTVKQIAEYCGVDERTVRRWILKASDKRPGLLDKLSEAEKTKMAAEYDLDETMAAIEAGMGKVPADVYRTNAVNAEMAKRPEKAEVSAAKISALIRATDKGYLTADQFRSMIGAPQVEPPKPATVSTLAALPAPKVYKPVAFPALGTIITDVYAVCGIVGKNAGWVESTSRKLDIRIGRWDRADVLNLYLKAGGRGILSNPSPARVDAEVERIEAARKKGYCR